MLLPAIDCVLIHLISFILGKFPEMESIIIAGTDFIGHLRRIILFTLVTLE